MRNYKRNQGAGAYLTNYSEEDMKNAVSAVRDGKSLRKAADEFGVPKSTLQRKVKQQQMKPHGRQLRLTSTCENALVVMINQLSEWRMPVNYMEIRLLVKNYLDGRNVVDMVFNNNFPGTDWASMFVKRHKLTLRIADQVKPCRVDITEDAVNNYFNHLENSLEGVPPSQVYNYDETNMTDDPSRKKCIVRRGLRRVEEKIQHSKQAFSVMFCGSATGIQLPPMVVYKAKHLYKNWTEGGVTGSVYSTSKSGWFNMDTYEEWFFKIFLPHVQGVSGPKLLIGDNLSSHFSPAVITACIEHDIRFVTLIPNSTHICQPLDVSVFRPMKRIWGCILQNWRKETQLRGTIPKETFPTLLYRVFRNLDAKNLIAGFRACGIVPFNRDEVLKRLVGKSSKDPGGDETINVLNESCLNLLKNYCGIGETTKSPRKTRGPKIVPGKAIDISEVIGDDTEEKVWKCSHCTDLWMEDDNRWILCDICDTAFHLQCSGIQYNREDYYDLNLKNMDFSCDNCK